MTTCLGMSHSVSLLCVSFVSVCVWPSFSFGFEGGMWDVIILVSDHCLSFHFGNLALKS